MGTLKNIPFELGDVVELKNPMMKVKRNEANCVRCKHKNHKNCSHQTSKYYKSRPGEYGLIRETDPDIRHGCYGVSILEDYVSCRGLDYYYVPLDAIKKTGINAYECFENGYPCESCQQRFICGTTSLYSEIKKGYPYLSLPPWMQKAYNNGEITI